MELASASVRHELTFEAFKEYAVPPAQVLTLFFPYLFGGGVPPLSGPFIGKWNLAETLGYVGLLPLTLAAIGSWCCRGERLVRFWIAVTFVAFLLALGDETPLVSVTYYLPVINKLRAPARHFQEMTFALGILAAFGVKAVQTRRAPTRIVLSIATAMVLFVLAALLIVALNYPMLQARASSQHIALPEFSANLAVWVPIGVLLLGVLALANWMRNRDGNIPRGLVVAVVAIDLASFGFFAEWRYALDNRVLAVPDYAAKYSRDLAQHQQRIMPMRGWAEPLHGFSPTMSQLYSMRSVSGYGPLLIRRYTELSRVTQGGWADPVVLMPIDRAADLIAARYVVVSGTAHRAYAITADGIMLGNRERFEFVETIAGSSIYKNLRALPRAWLVPNVMSAQPAQILEAIRTSVAPDGTAFDPRSMAFVEEPFNLDSSGPTGPGAARVVETSSDTVIVTTEATAPAFLVLSDVYYPGWVATIDNREAKIFQTNYALRGVAVPAGKHTVTFRYRPLSFYWGLVIAIAALVGLIAIGMFARRQGSFGSRPNVVGGC